MTHTYVALGSGSELSRPVRLGRAPRLSRGLAALALLAATGAHAQQRLTAAFLRDEPTAAASPLAAALRQSRPLVLDVAATRALLATAPAENQAGAAPLVLALPLPDGQSARFAVVETAVMAPALAARYPAIKTYAGIGLDDRTASVRLDLTPRGFHAQILSSATGTVYIDPARRGDVQHYLSFFKRDINPTASARAACEFQPTPADLKESARRLSAVRGPGGPAEVASGATRRTYRVCVAATGEYTAFSGGTVASAQAAIVTSVNRVVGVYEKELAVRLVLIPGNDRVVYVDAATDPYTNNNGSAMLSQNQTTLDNVIGSANYDIGHVFSTGGGGVAGLGVVCGVRKANGVTGSSSPVGDSFDIDYVAHEMGHQFGGNHPFNGSTGSCAGGNRNPNTAWEPGSGSTIMAYAGICSPQDLQPNSDAQFHVGNFEEMRTFILSTGCPTVTVTGNTPPAVTIPAGGKTLPAATPFKLTASATDGDGDALTYSWEELDLGPTGSPTATQVAGQTPPLFRSFVPSTSPTRYFPRLSNLINNTVVIGERLPTVTRTLKFKCTARDEHSGPAGVIGGVTSSDLLNLNVTSTAGPFLVTAPNTAVTWTGASTQTVTWDVAGTTANGVNCANVNLRLSTDGGLTYPTVLAANEANDGSATVTVPSVATTRARVMVEAADNYFFDISDADFSITSSTVCNAPTALTMSNITTTSATVSFAANGSTTGYVITTSPATTTQTVPGTTANLTGLTPGTSYTVSIVSNCAAGVTSAAATVRFTTLAPPTCATPSELSATAITTTSATINFVGSASATGYTLTTVPATTTQTLPAGASSANLTGLTPGTSYTVSIVSNCSAGVTSAAGTLTFFTRALPPTNDLCANAIALTCGTRVTGTTLGSTATGDPTTSCGGQSVDGGGVFYTIVGNGASLTVTMCGAPTVYDSKLFAYTGSCGGPYTCVAGNDDSPCGVASTITFNTTVGTTYLIFVSGYDGETGDFGIVANCGTPPPPCAAPTNLVVSSITATSASVAFTPSTTATNYTVTTTPATTTQTATTSPVTLIGLTANTAYTVNIVSNCSGAVSAAATATFRTSVVTATAQASGATFRVWPNPAGQHAAFRVTLEAPAAAAVLSLHNVLGQRVAGRAFSGTTAELPTTGLAVGTYLLTVQVAGQAPAVRRVVIE